MKNLTHTEVRDRWLKAQGDMTLTPDHPDRRTDTDECNKCFNELLRRGAVLMEDKKSRVVESKKVNTALLLRRVKLWEKQMLAFGIFLTIFIIFLHYETNKENK